MSKLVRDASWLQLLITYIKQDWAYGGRVKWEQLWEVETLKRGRSQHVIGGGKSQVNQEYDIPSPEKDWWPTLQESARASLEDWPEYQPSPQDSRGCPDSDLPEAFALPYWKRSRCRPTKKIGRLSRVIKKEEFKKQIRTWLMFEAPWSEKGGMISC
jgi:hypothetical protein